jgi:tetratricopeptide (TPR) repeat protein
MKTTLLLILLTNLFLGLAMEHQEGTPAKPSLSSTTDDREEIRDLLRKLQANPKSPYLHNQLAVLYGSDGNMAGFEKQINIAIELEPMDPINYFQASLVYGRSGQKNKQRLMLEKALARDPSNPVFHFELGRICEREGKRARAKKEYLEAKRLLAIAVRRGRESNSDHVLRDFRVVEGTYYDSFNNAYSVENLRLGIEKALARISG